MPLKDNQQVIGKEQSVDLGMGLNPNLNQSRGTEVLLSSIQGGPAACNICYK
uniref:Uncharacterized protein n=1 Tax=Nelumbo nucifera TaxID=4432 RepID=A0A822Y2A9_NELNU|nr:TPA_asm: hypothetical protein HUJ06_026659 [Nelumbo nucifera]